jgi:large subunit ribosomal protein L21e|tara:strand:- start:3744 stop:4034 length:291 start_codon:yes stop_codon:yes gene_type:complete
MNKIGGSRRKARHKFTKERRAKGKISITRFMQKFDSGQKVHLIIEPSVHRGMFHQRFVGKTGVVKAARGACYEVSINDGGKEKTLLVHPIHLKTAR